MSFISRLWREDVEQLSATYKEEENFKTTGMHSSESMEATFFLNHISTMWTYKLYERLRLHTSLDKHAASQLRDLQWDAGATNAEPQGSWPHPEGVEKGHHGRRIPASDNAWPRQYIH